MNETWLKFVAEWLRSGKLEQTAGELVVLAERAGVELRGETVRAKQTRLGLMLSRKSGEPFEVAGVQIEIKRLSPHRGVLRWTFHQRTTKAHLAEPVSGLP